MKRQLYYIIFFGVFIPLGLAVGFAQIWIGLPLMKEHESVLLKLIIAAAFVLPIPAAFYGSAWIAERLSGSVIAKDSDSSVDSPSWIRAFLHWLPVAASVPMLLCAMSLDFGALFYALLKWVVFVSAWVGAAKSFNAKAQICFWIAVVLLIVFNPIFPFRFSRDIWQIIDAFAAGIIVVVFFRTWRVPRAA